MRKLPVALALALASSTLACTTYRDQLVRSQQASEQNQHERTLGLLRALEPDVRKLSPPEQAQYAYLRGITDLRLGYRADARHWLAIAKAHDEASPGTLPSDWKARTTEALDAMNGVVYNEGYAALAASPKPGEEPLEAAPTPKSPK